MHMGYTKVRWLLLTNAKISDNTFEREPVRFQSVAVEANLRYVNGTSNSSMASPMEWAAQQALMVEDIYSGSTEWMSPPMTLNHG